uniref:Chitin elicitor receptor kinase 1 isoform X1 n=1 Tax=Rhizophora mucronata TaxID=61149 RepID=A0A2P2MP68_RHIMU
MANKIGQGGFGSVYYAELRGEKAAIKKMDMQASKEFFAELKVLTHVHHLNLVMQHIWHFFCPQKRIHGVHTAVYFL